ncbi:MAG: glycosyltransferase [Chloroflexi bacterium]|nr:glycosyltransferase [Chloroflexota bacterium]
MYPLGSDPSGPIVRITHLRDELAGIVDLDVIAGYRGARRRELARYAFGRRMRRLDGIYVESSTFLPAEADIAFLALARALGVPVLTYIRDAYQLFDEYYQAETPRRWLGRHAFLPFVHALRAVSSRLAFPTVGLAAAVGLEAARVVILPPGSPPPVPVARAEGARQVLYVGDARWPAQGVDRLIEAVGLARAAGVALELTIVSDSGEERRATHPTWVHVRRAQGSQIHDLLPNVLMTVIPRPRGPYNDLALPIKLFEYLAYGRPLVVTDCVEQARIVRDTKCGLVVGDGADELAEGLTRVAQAEPDVVDRWSGNAIAAAARASWAYRARDVVEALLAEAPPARRERLASAVLEHEGA